jgi:hypothetical protein
LFCAFSLERHVREHLPRAINGLVKLDAVLATSLLGDRTANRIIFLPDELMRM